MLPKKNRISRALFDTLLKGGIFFHSEHLSLRVIKQQKGLLKFSFVVSKKVSKSAVTRNLLRRRGYVILLNTIKTKSKDIMNVGIIGAFFFKKGAEKLGFPELQEEIAFLLKKAKII